MGSFKEIIPIIYWNLKRDKSSFLRYAIQCHFPRRQRFLRKHETVLMVFKLPRLLNNHKSNWTQLEGNKQVQDLLSLVTKLYSKGWTRASLSFPEKNETHFLKPVISQSPEQQGPTTNSPGLGANILQGLSWWLSWEDTVSLSPDFPIWKLWATTSALQGWHEGT